MVMFFYLSKYFDLLNKDGSLWLSNFISHIFYLFNDKSEESEFEIQKRKFKRKIRKLKIFCILSNLILMFVLLFYFWKNL